MPGAQAEASGRLTLFSDLLTFDDPIWSFSLERMLTDVRAFGLTDASPVQRAVCRVLDGLPLGALANDPDVVSAFGGPAAVAELPRTKPKELVLLCGIRGGKSLIAAASAVKNALTCDVSSLGPGEVPRSSIVSLKLDIAGATWEHVRGRIQASAELRALLIGEPRADSLMIRHPSGRKVEIKIVAGAKAAAGLVARWSAGVVFDEAPRMAGQEDGVVNLDDARISVSGRLLPGAQVLMPGSPWAPFGPVYELVQKHHGKPTPGLVVVRAPAWAMNPSWWTKERCAELQRIDPDAYEVDVLCNFLAPSSTMFAAAEIEACATLPLESPPNELLSYVAVIDPATRGNAWTLMLLANTGGGMVHVALIRQWIGSTAKPLSPRGVLAEIAGILKPYNVTTVNSDQWSADAIRELALDVGLYLKDHAINALNRSDQFMSLRARISGRKIAFPREPMLMKDLGGVRKRATTAGLAIDLPMTADGRHCDYAACLGLGILLVLPEPSAPPPVPTEKDYSRQRKAELSEQILKRQRRQRWVMPD